MTSAPPLPSRSRVRRLRLRVARRDQLQRGTLLLQDAFSIAGLPGDNDRRLVYVRSLDVGRISASATSAGVSLQIRRAALDLRPVHAADARAADAAAVYFNDPVEPALALARLLARRELPSAWYWPLAAPVWPLPAAVPAALRALILHVAEMEEAPAALLEIVAVLQAHNSLDALLEALTSTDGDLLLRSLTGRTAAAALAGVDQPRAVIGRSPLGSSLQRLSRRLPVEDPRLLWLAALAWSEGSSARLASPQVLARAADLGRAARALALDADERSTASLADPPDVPFSRGPSRPTPRDDEPATTAPVADPAQATPAGEPGQYAAIASDAAGLFYVLNPLQQLGFGAWLEENPAYLEAGLPSLLLRHAAVAAGLDPEDAAFAALPDERGPDEAEAETGLPPGALVQVIEAWTEKIDAWCRQQAGIPLTELILRPGWLQWSRTHLDVSFRLRDVDIRIRRAGFDINPGWLPWFGRVVTYWYLDDGELP